MFFISLFTIVLLSHSITGIDSFLQSISFGWQYKYGGFKLYISYFYFPLFFSVFENIFKLHDRISDLIGIRFRFDRDVIISKYLSELKLSQKINRVNHSNRDTIMHDIFYKYASSTNPKIDRHLIDRALEIWSWYWILLDTIACIGILGILSLSYYFSWSTCFVLIVIITICLAIMYTIKKYQCREYAIAEVNAILQLDNCRSTIRRYLNHAL